MYYFWLGREAELPPECDGDFEHMECIESDGFITCYFSGPISPLPDSGEVCVSWGTTPVHPKTN